MLLGAPLVAACRDEAARSIEGTLVDTGMRRGHAMRDVRGIPAVPEGRWRRTGVVVIGAGVAGLGAAWWLKRNGRSDVTVIELDDVVGGTARGGASSITPYPWAAHYVVAPRADEAAMVALFEEQGAIEGHDAHGDPIIDEALRCRDPEERMWFRGRWTDGLYLYGGATAEDLAQLARFDAAIDRWAAWKDASGRPAFAVPISACSPDPIPTALDRESFASWLDRQGLTSERLRWMVDYACRDDYDLMAADTSAWAGVYYFAARRRAPGASRAVVTWPDGNAHLIAHLARRVATIEAKLAVIDVRAVASGVEVIALADDGPVGIRAAHAVVAVPQHVAARIVAARREAPIALPDCGAWAVANVHLRGRPRERPGDAPPSWDNVIRDSPSLGYVTATHQRGRDVGPTVLTWYYPFPDADGAAVRKRLAGAGHGEWAATAVADLGRVHRDLPPLVERVDVAFWGHGMVRPRVGAMFGGGRAAAAAPIGAIHFAHTDLSGMAMFEEALDHGVRAARAILAVPA